MKTSPVTTACCAIAPGHIYTELADPATVSIKIQSYQLITVLAEHNNLTMNTSTHTPYTYPPPHTHTHIHVRKTDLNFLDAVSQTFRSFVARRPDHITT